MSPQSRGCPARRSRSGTAGGRNAARPGCTTTPRARAPRQRRSSRAWWTRSSNCVVGRSGATNASLRTWPNAVSPCPPRLSVARSTVTTWPGCGTWIRRPASAPAWSGTSTTPRATWSTSISRRSAVSRPVAAGLFTSAAPRQPGRPSARVPAPAASATPTSTAPLTITLVWRTAKSCPTSRPSPRSPSGSELRRSSARTGSTRSAAASLTTALATALARGLALSPTPGRRTSGPGHTRPARTARSSDTTGRWSASGSAGARMPQRRTARPHSPSS